MAKALAAKSQMFTLRVWVEDVGNACAERQPEVACRSSRSEIRGTLKHVLTGETLHFRDWQTLIQYIEMAHTIEIDPEQPHKSDSG